MSEVEQIESVGNSNLYLSSVFELRSVDSCCMRERRLDCERGEGSLKTALTSTFSQANSTKLMSIAERACVVWSCLRKKN